MSRLHCGQGHFLGRRSWNGWKRGNRQSVSMHSGLSASWLTVDAMWPASSSFSSFDSAMMDPMPELYHRINLFPTKLHLSAYHSIRRRHDHAPLPHPSPCSICYIAGSSTHCSSVTWVWEVLTSLRGFPRDSLSFSGRGSPCWMHIDYMCARWWCLVPWV